MKTKAIFLDVDGTLISFKTHKIPQTTIDALNQVHNNGIKIIISTGRVATDLGELDAIPYDAVVSLNGSHCCSVTALKSLPAKSVMKISE